MNTTLDQQQLTYILKKAIAKDTFCKFEEIAEVTGIKRYPDLIWVRYTLTNDPTQQLATMFTFDWFTSNQEAFEKEYLKEQQKKEKLTSPLNKNADDADADDLIISFDSTSSDTVYTFNITEDRLEEPSKPIHPAKFNNIRKKAYRLANEANILFYGSAKDVYWGVVGHISFKQYQRFIAIALKKHLNYVEMAIFLRLNGYHSGSMVEKSAYDALIKNLDNDSLLGKVRELRSQVWQVK